MSRIGNQPIELKDGVEFSIDADNVVTIKGDKGTDTLKLDDSISVKEEDGLLTVSRSSEEKIQRSLHGLYRSLI